MLPLPSSAQSSGPGSRWVPRHLGTVDRFVRMLPARFGEWLLRVTGSEQLLAAGARSAERSEYEARAAASAPSRA